MQDENCHWDPQRGSISHLILKSSDFLCSRCSLTGVVENLIQKKSKTYGNILWSCIPFFYTETGEKLHPVKDKNFKGAICKIWARHSVEMVSKKTVSECKETAKCDSTDLCCVELTSSAHSMSTD